MTTLDSGLGFNTEVTGVEAEAEASNSSSGPSSGMVGWLKLCLGCFLKITGASMTSDDTEVKVETVEEGDVCRALEGKGLISVGGLDVVWVILGVVLTIKGGVHKGEMDFLLVSAVRGCNLSGLRALLSKGEPGSALLGRLKDFFAELGVNEDPKGE